MRKSKRLNRIEFAVTLALAMSGAWALTLALAMGGAWAWASLLVSLLVLGWARIRAAAAAAALDSLLAEIEKAPKRTVPKSKKSKNRGRTPSGLARWVPEDGRAYLYELQRRWRKRGDSQWLIELQSNWWVLGMLWGHLHSRIENIWLRFNKKS